MATCNTMCPVSEVRFRSKNGLINQLEATENSRNGPRSKYVPDNDRMVKEYSRSAADTHKYNKPELLRPFPILMRTVDYLLDLFAHLEDRRQDVSSNNFSSVFTFVSDRLRAVRQDMIMQKLDGRSTIVLMEKMLPFYIETDGSCKMGKCLSYNQKLHDFQLEECFGRWYEEVDATDKIIPDPLISAAFFFRRLHRVPTILQDLYQFRRKLSEETFILTRSIISSFLSNNYYRFFKIFKNLDPLLQYSLSDSVLSLRQSAMQVILAGYKTPISKLPSRLMSVWLGFPSNLEVFNAFLRLYNVIPDEQGNVHISSIKLNEIPTTDLYSRQYK